MGNYIQYKVSTAQAIFRNKIPLRSGFQLDVHHDSSKLSALGVRSLTFTSTRRDHAGHLESAMPLDGFLNAQILVDYRDNQLVQVWSFLLIHRSVFQLPNAVWLRRLSDETRPHALWWLQPPTMEHHLNQLEAQQKCWKKTELICITLQFAVGRSFSSLHSALWVIASVGSNLVFSFHFADLHISRGLNPFLISLYLISVVASRTSYLPANCGS